MKTATYQKELPICPKEYDVIVIGGGSAGICASIAAAREGARTLLVENTGWLGGIGTTCAMVALGFIKRGEHRIIGGIPYELEQRMKALGGTLHFAENGEEEALYFSPETFAHAALTMCEEAGVELLFHTRFIDCITGPDERIRGVVLSHKGGLEIYCAHTYIDCSGDGDVFASAGLPWKMGRDIDGLAQPMTLLFFVGDVNYSRFWEACNADIVTYFHKVFGQAREQGAFRIPITRPGSIGIVPHYGREHDPSRCEVFINSTNILGKSGIDPVELSEAERITRKQVYELFDFFKNNVPGFENSYLSMVPTQIGVRETRRLEGAYKLTMDDLTSCRKFPDTVAIGWNTIDVHQVAGHDFDLTDIPVGRHYCIPYRSLYPLGLKNLLVAGRCISADHEALGAIRVMNNTMPIGEGAGTAAALCVRNNCNNDQLDPQELQDVLKKNGVVLSLYE